MMIHAAHIHPFALQPAALLPGLRGGLGDGYQTATQITQIGGQAATIAITATSGASAATSAGAAAATAASAASWAIPIIGAGVLAATLVLGAIAKRNAQKKAATQIVNEVEPQLRANKDAYLSGPRTQASQAQALQNFDLGWKLILDNCGQESLGSAGRRCISERDRGGIYDYHAWYRDPIAQDTPRTNPVESAAAELFPQLTDEQIKEAPRMLALLAIALGVAML